MDLARLSFASLVLVTHSFDLLGRDDEEPLRHVFGHAIGFGGVGVWGFFLLSGYLISKSWCESPSLLTYFRNRFLRIWPGFAVACILSIAIAYAMVPAQPFDAGLILHDLLTVHEPRAAMPGPVPYANGSLWTIKWEVVCYLLTPLVVGRRWALAMGWVYAVVLACQIGWLTPFGLIVIFLSGAAWYRFGLAARVTPRLPLLPRFPDISYGVYLYGWPVQKLLIAAGITSPWWLIAASLPTAGLAGLASWYGVERYALRLKSFPLPSLRRAGKPVQASA